MPYSPNNCAPTKVTGWDALPTLSSLGLPDRKTRRLVTPGQAAGTVPGNNTTVCPITRECLLGLHALLGT